MSDFDCKMCPTTKDIQFPLFHSDVNQHHISKINSCSVWNNRPSSVLRTRGRTKNENLVLHQTNLGSKLHQAWGEEFLFGTVSLVWQGNRKNTLLQLSPPLFVTCVSGKSLLFLVLFLISETCLRCFSTDLPYAGQTWNPSFSSMIFFMNKRAGEFNVSFLLINSF